MVPELPTPWLVLKEVVAVLGSEEGDEGRATDPLGARDDPLEVQLEPRHFCGAEPIPPAVPAHHERAPPAPAVHLHRRAEDLQVLLCVAEAQGHSVPLVHHRRHLHMHLRGCEEPQCTPPQLLVNRRLQVLRNPAEVLVVEEEGLIRLVVVDRQVAQPKRPLDAVPLPPAQQGLLDAPLEPLHEGQCEEAAQQRLAAEDRQARGVQALRGGDRSAGDPKGDGGDAPVRHGGERGDEREHHEHVTAVLQEANVVAYGCAPHPRSRIQEVVATRAERPAQPAQPQEVPEAHAHE
mmetsp:Transcript_46114/g.142852  ORF Transcript_46114/g.142852 Transcript_46114/m.142852 type:complete len:292 (-) Transcript_46114:316-1191(-)